MATFTLSGFTAQDILDFAKSKQWTETINIDEEQVPNPVSAGQYCKNYFRMLCRNDIKAYRLKIAKEAVGIPVEPEIEVE